MGMYTELVLGVRLKENCPKHIVEMLKVMFGLQPDLPEKYSDWKDTFPQTGRIPFGGSYYFAVQNSHSRMSWDNISNDWTLSIRCNIKNYDDEINNFLKWISPFVARGSGENDDFCGYWLYEEDVAPTLIWLVKGKLGRWK
jgi:hypothetical protein